MTPVIFKKKLTTGVQRWKPITIFLPRLVPHTFSIKQSTSKKTMPWCSRSLTPVPIINTKDSSNRTPLIEVSTDSTLQFAPRHMTHLIMTLFEGNPIFLTRILLKSYQMTLLATSSVLAALAGTNSKGDAKILAHILDSLFNSDPVSANKILLDIYTEGPYNSDSKAPALSSSSLLAS